MHTNNYKKNKTEIRREGRNGANLGPEEADLARADLLHGEDLLLGKDRISRQQIVEEKSCLFQEGGHLGPNLPPLDPVSPHFPPPVIIQGHLLAGFMKTAQVGSWKPHTLN